MSNRFAGFADNGGVPDGTFMPTTKVKKVDYDTSDISRGPYYSMLDRQARARQAITGESYASAFTKVYCAPENRSIVDQARSEHLAKGEDAICGTRLSAIPVQKVIPAADAKQAYVKQAVDNRGPFHTKLHEMAIEHSKQHGLFYQQSYTRLLTSPENVQIRAGIAAESGVRTLSLEEAMALAPAPAFPAYRAPGHASDASPVGRSGRKPPNYAGG